MDRKQKKQLQEQYSADSFALVRKALDGCEVLKRVSDARGLVIDELVAKGELLIADQGFEICTEGESSDDVYFIVRGRISIVSGLSEVARRGDGEFVGEMALLLIAPRRSATMVTLEDSVLWKVTGRHFESIANAQPLLWRGLALRLSERLKERDWMAPKENPTPRVFFGSSGEHLEVLRSIEAAVRATNVPSDLRLWADAFCPADLTLDRLVEVAAEVDIAVMLITPDDIVRSRKKQSGAPRDNVVFEAGLFMGNLGRRRVLPLVPADVKPKLPSDWLSWNWIGVDRTPEGYAAAAKKIAEIVQHLGVRPLFRKDKPDHLKKT